MFVNIKVILENIMRFLFLRTLAGYHFPEHNFTIYCLFSNVIFVSVTETPFQEF